jgi:hypothetical protein
MRNEELYLTWLRALPAVARDWLWKQAACSQVVLCDGFSLESLAYWKSSERSDLRGSLRLRLAEIFTSIHERFSSLSHKKIVGSSRIS